MTRRTPISTRTDTLCHYTTLFRSRSGAVQWENEPGITLTGEVFYTKLKEHNRAAGMNISNRWTGLGWTTPTQSSQAGVISHGNGGPWLDVDQYDLDAWWVNSFTVNRTTDSHTTDFNLQLDSDRGDRKSKRLKSRHS